MLNSTGIETICNLEKSQLLKKAPNKNKVDWYMDQLLISDLVKDYLNEFGWNKLHSRSHLDSSGRVDRKLIAGRRWSNAVDKALLQPYRDTHMCRETYSNSCWWSLYHLLGRHMMPNDLELIMSYRNEFLNEMLTNPFVGSIRQNQGVKNEEDLRQKYLELGLFDIRNEWTQLYPRIYKDEKPLFVDWDHQRVFREVITSHGSTKDTVINLYKVIPNEPEVVEEVRSKYFCDSCKEMFFAR